MREFVITDASMPRLDSALLAQYPQLSPGRLHKYLRENKIKVDGKKLPLSARLPRGSTVRVFLPDMLLDKPDGPLFLSARPELCAVYEDSDVLVADKPAGLPVTDEDGRTADTLINRALLYLYHKANMRRNTAGLRASAIGSIPARPVLCSLPRRSRLKRFCCTL